MVSACVPIADTHIIIKIPIVATTQKNPAIVTCCKFTAKQKKNIKLNYSVQTIQNQSICTMFSVHIKIAGV
jgi:hypothetical protein